MGPLFYKLPAQHIIPDYKEAARYSGYTQPICDSDIVSAKIKDCCSQLQKILMPQAVFQEFPLTVLPPDQADGPSTIQFANITIKSKDLGTNLKGCSSIVLFAATIGPMTDTLIRKTQNTGSADAAFMQACGAMFIESFVDLLNDYIKQNALCRGLKSHPRYSPGYGDVPLSFQKNIFNLLPCSKIGLTLMDSLIMAPEKSVTALIGLE